MFSIISFRYNSIPKIGSYVSINALIGYVMVETTIYLGGGISKFRNLKFINLEFIFHCK